MPGTRAGCWRRKTGSWRDWWAVWCRFSWHFLCGIDVRILEEWVLFWEHASSCVLAYLYFRSTNQGHTRPTLRVYILHGVMKYSGKSYLLGLEKDIRVNLRPAIRFVRCIVKYRIWRGLVALEASWWKKCKRFRRWYAFSHGLGPWFSLLVRTPRQYQELNHVPGMWAYVCVRGGVRRANHPTV